MSAALAFAIGVAVGGVTVALTVALLSRPPGDAYSQGDMVIHRPPGRDAYARLGRVVGQQDRLVLVEFCGPNDRHWLDAADLAPVVPSVRP